MGFFAVASVVGSVVDLLGTNDFDACARARAVGGEMPPTILGPGEFYLAITFLVAHLATIAALIRQQAWLRIVVPALFYPGSFLTLEIIKMLIGDSSCSSKPNSISGHASLFTYYTCLVLVLVKYTLLPAKSDKPSFLPSRPTNKAPQQQHDDKKKNDNSNSDNSNNDDNNENNNNNHNKKDEQTNKSQETDSDTHRHQDNAGPSWIYWLRVLGLATAFLFVTLAAVTLSSTWRGGYHSLRQLCYGGLWGSASLLAVRYLVQSLHITKLRPLLLSFVIVASLICFYFFPLIKLLSVYEVAIISVLWISLRFYGPDDDDKKKRE